MAVDPISTLLIVGVLVAATGFVGMYATNSPWRLSGVGKALMTTSLGVVLLATVALLFNLLGPDYPYRVLFRDLAYLVLNIGMWWQLINLVRAQNRVNRLPAPRERFERKTDEPQDKDRVA